ncbi:DEAD/DEAH box helicase [Pseudonocardia nematodicida]|uniref:DEAD/DEAH box helicase n=1 Tax=Pseudonocardia nematodicida TaxID=1206997 RepID=A0ABV1KID8_9PSEU
MSRIGCTQLSFLVERETFAWWGGPDPQAAAAELGLAATPEPVRIARPDAGRIVSDPLTAALSPAGPTLTALDAHEDRSGWGDSVRAWRALAPEILRGADPAPVLPVAGHAGLGGDGTTIWSAASAVRAAARAARHDDHEHAVRSRLRPYQRSGARWLDERLDTAGGAVLADEMGLGKTVQAIAVLADRPGPHLVVCPSSVVATWRRELDRFAPGVAVVEHRRGATAPPDGVVVATYGMLARDDALTAAEWDVAVLDEAQHVRNPATATARRARALRARGRIALTGTPVENRLDDLWSLLAVTTPEVLGSRARFRRRFATAADPGAAADRLHALVGPHLLRRRKAEVAAELPPRIEVTHELDPTSEQHRRYTTALDGAFRGGLGTGIDRRGRVLALLTRLKQLCVHPSLVTVGDDARAVAGRSAVFDRLTELVTEIVDNGEAALVFTQYRTAGELLAGHLAGLLGTEIPFLHGGLTRPARERLVEQFSGSGPGSGDGPPVLVLSLRAAGTGLTLTRATHVLHLDRWWNPAVEAQASDRAHRIGQTRAVTVHTFTTRGTVEELIAELHRGKRDLAGAALGETESGSVGALARLGDDELRAALEGAR